MLEHNLSEPLKVIHENLKAGKGIGHHLLNRLDFQRLVQYALADIYQRINPSVKRTPTTEVKLEVPKTPEYDIDTDGTYSTKKRKSRSTVTSETY